MSKRKQFIEENVPLTAPIFYILLSLATKESHGYEIMKQVEADSQGKIKLGAGTLYGAIKRMLEDRLVIEVDSEHARRKYYKLTEKGRAIFTNELKRYNEAVELAKSKKVFVLNTPKRVALAYV